MPFIAAGDLTVHYELRGAPEAPVVMLANSLGTSFHVWDAQADFLARRYRVLRYDMRGHGLTEGTASGAGLDGLADDALALLDALDLSSVLFCGLSIGGMVGQRLAAKAPQRVAALVLCDTAMRIGTPEIWDTRIAAIRSHGLAAIADGVMQRWFTKRFLEERAAEVRGWRTMLLRTPAEGYIAGCAAVRDGDLSGDAAAIRCPTLVVIGDQDLATPPAAGRELAATIPGARFVELAEAAHIPTVEQPAALNRLIGEFLASAVPAIGADDGLLARGFAVRSAVLGTAHVERARRRATAFDRDFQEFITRQAWGEIWTRPGLDRRTRSMLTIAMLAALGHERELKLHIRATRNTGVSSDEVKEILLQSAIYAGVPAANTAFQHARETYEEMEKEETP